MAVFDCNDTNDMAIVWPTKPEIDSEIDDIEIIHTAHNRQGFAAGAVLAAEFLTNKKGIYTMKDVLNFY